MIASTVETGGRAGERAPSPSTPASADTLVLSDFSQLVANLRAFRAHDADGDGVLQADGVRLALADLGLLKDAETVDALIAQNSSCDGVKGAIDYTYTMVQFVRLVTLVDARQGGAARPEGGPDDDAPVQIFDGFAMLQPSNRLYA